MNFNNSFTLKDFAVTAKNEFSKTKKNLGQLERKYNERMNGRSVGQLIGAIIGNTVWCAVFVVAFLFCREMLEEEYLLYAFLAPLLLSVFMFIDNIIKIVYYGRISYYRSSVSHLNSRVDAALKNTDNNHTGFMNSKSKGWNFPLKAASSIPEETASIEREIDGMSSIEKNFLNTVKNIFYFTTVVLVSFVVCYSLFEYNKQIINEILGAIGGNISDDASIIINFVTVAVTLIIEIILARLIWSKTNCVVGNVTLLSLLIAPVAFLLLDIIVSVVVALIAAIIYIAAIIIGVVLFFWICTTCSEG